MPILPPKVYHPRCVVVLQVLFDQTPPPTSDAGLTTLVVSPATFTAIPRSVTVERNSARKADTARIELDYRDFPLDPRMLADVLVSVHIEEARDPLGRVVPTELNKRFVGLVDEPRVTLGPEGHVVRMAARDYTGIYLDFRWGGNAVETPKGATLQSVVEAIRTKVTPATAPALFTDPSAAAADVSARTGRTLFAVDDDDSAWDVLSGLCDLFGLVPVWDLDQLTIVTPSGPGTGSALMVFGANVARLEFARALKQQRYKQVKIVAWDPVQGLALEAVFPPAAMVTRVSTTGTPKSDTKQVQYNVEGPYTPTTLAELAERVHAELAQQQLEGELETREMVDLLEGSLLGLKNGDTLIVKLGPDDNASIAGMSAAEAIAFLSNPTKVNALDPVVAAVLVDAWQAAQQLSVQFYVVEVVHDWARDDGYRLVVRFREFVLGV